MSKNNDSKNIIILNLVLNETNSVFVEYLVGNRTLNMIVDVIEASFNDIPTLLLKFPVEFYDSIANNGPIMGKFNKIIRRFLSKELIDLPYRIGHINEVYSPDSE